LASTRWSAYVIEPHRVRLDRTYLLIITSGVFYGACVAWQYEEIVHPLLVRLGRQTKSTFDERVARYERLELRDPTFLHLDRANFCWPCDDVFYIQIQARSFFARHWTASTHRQVGLVTFARTNGEERRFIIPGPGDIASMSEHFPRLFPYARVLLK
jgi:hypothetical protein